MAIGYDDIPEMEDILLDLQLREGSGAVTHDWAKPHHEEITLVNTPTWTSLASGENVLALNGTNEYLQALAADTADLDFTSGDYSISMWVKITDTATSEILIGRYGVSLDGWELYWTKVGAIRYLTMRHHHASLAPSVRTACYSVGWTEGIWYHLVITRSGAYPLHYRNGVAVDTTYDVAGVSDPDTCNRDLVIGTRYTKDANWFKGQLDTIRVWDRALASTEPASLFERDRDLYGV